MGREPTAYLPAGKQSPSRRRYRQGVTYGVLLVDYGEVISTPQPRADVAGLVSLSGVDATTFSHRYWDGRLRYDLGLDPHAYWSEVVGREVDGPLLTSLVAADYASWSHHREPVVRLLHELRSAGVRLVLLSNSPLPFAARFRTEPLADLFDLLVLSAELGVAKPDAAIYEHALGAAGVAAAQAYFVDDRPVNVAAAQALGIDSAVFTGPADLRVALGHGIGHRSAQ